jgi:hypothetical protein
MVFTRKRLAVCAAVAVAVAVLASRVDPAPLMYWVRGHLTITGNLIVRGLTTGDPTSGYRIVMATPAAPTVVASQLGTDLAAGTYKITVVALDPGGGVTLYPTPVDCVITAGGAGRCAVTYAWPTGAVSVRIYTSAAGGATPDRYFATTKATLYNLDTLTGATVAALPTAATAYRMLVGSGNTTNWFGLPILTTVPNIGSTTTPGYTLQNPTAAAAGAQQYSPGFSQIGQGWSTAGAGASMPVETRWELRPVQGAAAPTYNYVLMGRVNNGGWADIVTIGSSGNLSASGYLAAVGNIYLSTGANGLILGSYGRFSSVGADGLVYLANNAQTAGIRFQFAALPTIASGFCVAGGTNVVATGSTDSAGRVTVGTCVAETSGVVNFATAWSATGPITCLAQNESTPANNVKALPNALTGAVSMTLSQANAFVTGDVIKWMCMGPK